MKSINRALIAILFFIGFSCHEPKIELHNKNNLKNINSEEEIFNKKKKILFYSYRLEAGGIGKATYSLLKHLDYSKYEVDLIFMTKIGTPPSEFKELPKEINLIYLYDPFFKSVTPSNNSLIEMFRKGEMIFFENLMKVYKNSNWITYNWKLGNKKYDLEICLFSQAFELFINSPLNSKKVAWVHMDLKYENEFYHSSEISYTLKNLYKADKVITVSNQVKEVLLEVAPEIKDKIEVIYNPISVEEIRRKSKENIPEKKYEPLQLIALGRLHPQKGFDRLVNVVNGLKNEDKLNFHLWIVGQGPEETKLKAQIQKHGLENTIQLLGFRENPYPYLKDADAFVLSSRHEALPYVLLESTILSKPIVSTNISGSEELLKANLPEGALTSIGKYGLLTENSTEGIYQGLKEMITDKALRESFINKNPDFSAFETSNVVKQVETLFDEMMSE